MLFGSPCFKNILLQETKEELNTCGSVADSMRTCATGATADGDIWAVYSERINSWRMKRREDIDLLFHCPDFYLHPDDIDHVSAFSLCS